MQVLFARHHVRVYRFVLRMVRNEATAEDLISEVFLDVWRQAGKFEGRSAVSTWMLSIARFKALSALRRRDEEELDDETADAIEDHADDPEVALAKKDKGAVLRQCLSEIVDRASRDHRPRLLPREIGGGGRGNCRHSGSDREDAHVLRAQEIIRAPQGAGNRSRLAMNTANENERGDIEELLPWHAAGTLSSRDAQRVEAALASDPELARRYELVREELAQTIHLNETLGAPSARAMDALFAKIDAEPARQRRGVIQSRRRGIREFFAALSPRTLAWSASAAALAIVLQAAVIGGIVIKEQSAGGYQTASAPRRAPRRRHLRGDPVPAAGRCRRHHQVPGNQQTQHCRRSVGGRVIPGAHRGDKLPKQISTAPSRRCRSTRLSASSPLPE